ncbi:MAG: relaxase/mobilization nuclease domain-containing protein, partial [Lentilitoribacter sp.]
ILKGAQRGHALHLARHLLNDRDNDFVDVHEVSGFLCDDVTGAFKEIQAISKGTRCKQPFFSVSINPPADVSVTVEMFEKAADRIAEANGLSEQPRAIVLHEKEGRRHAHVVWSRIDAANMTAINLPHFKNKLQSVSRDLYWEYQWKMPNGLRDRSLKSPTNVTLAEWQVAKKRGKNAIDQKKLIQQCWAVSDNKTSFEEALAEHGYLLARGDRRNSHVIVCHDG